MDKAEKNISNLLQLRFGIIGNSRPMQDAMQKVMQAAPTDLTILITGETGTGKEVFANAIHGLSERKRAAFVSVNCGAIPETLLESELFGHEKGAFTGAVEQRKGFFEVAHKGTIFLDEIGEMPVGTQVKLLRVLESGEFSRLGSSTVHKVDVRVIAATNRKLEEEVREGKFRQDLFFRLNSVNIHLPPLRKHPEDVPLLIDYFADRITKKLGLEFKGYSNDTAEILKGLHWQGNIRELKNLIDTMITLEQGAYITPEILTRYLPAALPAHQPDSYFSDRSLVRIPEKDFSEQLELGLIFKSLLEIKSEIGDIKKYLVYLKESMNEIIDSDGIKYNYPTNEQEEKALDYDSLRVDKIEKQIIELALSKHKGNRKAAAAELGISERTLYRKLSLYNLD